MIGMHTYLQEMKTARDYDYGADSKYGTRIVFALLPANSKQLMSRNISIKKRPRDTNECVPGDVQ